MPKSKVGLLGGTFDPIHVGHLRGAEEIRETLQLEEIIFIPAYTPPHKTQSYVSPVDDRLRMLELATRDNDYFTVSDIEIRRGGTSYSIDTLKEFSQLNPAAEPYFIIGNELLDGISSWKDYKELLSITNFAVVQRPGYEDRVQTELPLAFRDDFRYVDSTDSVTTYQHRSQKVLTFVKIQGMQVSSTLIRTYVNQGRTVRYLVTEDVETYIAQNELYRKETVL